jgi:hypothetical protein
MSDEEALKPTMSPAPRATMELLAREVRETNKGVRKLGEGQARLEERMTGLDSRVDKVEQVLSNGHACSQGDRIAKMETKQDAVEEKVNTDINKGVRTQTALSAVKERVEDIAQEVSGEQDKSRSTRLQVGVTGVALIMTILSAVAGALWWASSFDTSVQMDRSQNTKVHKALSDGIKSNGSAVTKVGEKVGERLLSIERELKTGSAPRSAFEERYRRLSPVMKKRVKRGLPPELRYTLPGE